MLAEWPAATPATDPEVGPNPPVDWIDFLDALCRVTTEGPLSKILTTVVELTVSALGADACSLGLWDAAREEIVTQASADRRASTKRARFAPGQGVAGWVASQRQGLIIADARQDARYLSLEYPHTSSILSVPLIWDNELVGTLTVTSTRTDAFGDPELRVLDLFGAQAASLVAAWGRGNRDRAAHQKLAADAPADGVLVRDQDPAVVAVNRVAAAQDFAHDLKSPIGSIRGLISLVLMEAGGPLSPRQRDLLEHAQIAGDRLRAVVERLVDDGAERDGDDAPALQPTALAEVAGAVVARLEAVAAGRGITLEDAIAGDLPRVRADPFQLARVLENLLDNAMKFSRPGGRVWLDAALGNGVVECTVRDEGIGIPEWAVERVFERNYQVSTHDAAEGHGSGLGLAICRRIVEQHGGRVWAESAEGRGSTIRFTLPLAGHGEI